MLELFVCKKNKRELCRAIAEQLRCLRENEGLSFSELSCLTSISVDSLKELEDGQIRRMGHLFRLARYYNKQIKIEFY